MNQTKIVFSRSMNDPRMDKLEYLERRVRYFKRYGINMSHAKIALNDFKMSVYDFINDKTEEITNRIRIYNYKRRGSYGNNKAV